MLALYGRPDTWKWLLFFHILAAVVLVAAALAVSIASLAALRTATAEKDTFFRQAAFRLNVFALLPAFVAVIVLGGALADKEGLDDNSPDWLDIGWLLTELSGVIAGILFSLLQYWALRRARSGDHQSWQAKVVSYGTPVVLAVLLVVLFLMSAKPGSGIDRYV